VLKIFRQYNRWLAVIGAVFYGTLSQAAISLNSVECQKLFADLQSLDLCGITCPSNRLKVERIVASDPKHAVDLSFNLFLDVLGRGLTDSSKFRLRKAYNSASHATIDMTKELYLYATVTSVENKTIFLMISPQANETIVGSAIKLHELMHIRDLLAEEEGASRALRNLTNMPNDIIHPELHPLRIEWEYLNMFPKNVKLEQLQHLKSQFDFTKDNIYHKMAVQMLTRSHLPFSEYFKEALLIRDYLVP
jgi:hypothetical protein